jgi:mono/diheme cytochrome c family protein
MRNSLYFPILAGMMLMVPAGCKARPSNGLERTTINWAKHHVTVGYKKQPNPFAATPENIADGQAAFTQYCMVCHGLDGQNTGVPFAETISPAVPSLASPAVQSYTDGQLKWIIENGIWPSGMPPSRGIFSDDDMWKMVLYLRHLPKKGSLGEPSVYGGGGK